MIEVLKGGLASVAEQKFVSFTLFSPHLKMQRNAIVAAQTLIKSSGFGASLLTDINFNPEKNIVASPSNKELQFQFSVTPSMCNVFGSLHGGCTATLGDVFTTIHLWSLFPESKHVSIDLSVNYYRAVTVNTALLCTTRVLKSGKRIAFTEFEFANEKLEVVAKGFHNKSFV